MNKFGITQSITVGEFHPLFRSLLWVQQARSHDETRMALTFIEIENEGMNYNIIATDGKRMHVSTFDPGLFDDDFQRLDVGTYEVITKTGKLIVLAPVDDAPKFPNWRAIMPEKGSRRKMEERICARTTSVMGIRTGVLLATDFAGQAIGFGFGYKKDAYVNVEFAPDPSGHGAFLIEHELGRAIVMPMSLHNVAADQPKDDAEATPEMEAISAHFGRQG